MRYFLFLLLFLCVLIRPQCCLGATTVIINEIVWAGSLESANDEWLELYNTGSDVVDMTGWYLLAQDGSPVIELAGSIQSGAYYLIERTDDDSAPGVSADLIYSGSLANSGEALDLLDDSGELVDSLNCSDIWLAGDSSERIGMQKLNSLWVDNCDSTGSPGAVNIACAKIEEELSVDDELEGIEEVVDFDIEQEAASEIVSASDQKILQKSEPPVVIISEIMPNPLGVDNNEWIELYNQSKRGVDISAWILQDEQGEYLVAAKTYLRAGGYLLFNRQETNLALNNSGDKLNLIRGSDGEVISSVSFQNAIEATSLIFNKDSGQYLWTTCLSPGEANILEIPNREPVVDFSLSEKIETGELVVFDGSDSWDADGDTLEYAWQINDAKNIPGVLASQTFYTPGKYNIRLEVQDGRHKVTLSKKIVVTGEVIVVDSFAVRDAQIEVVKRSLDENVKKTSEKLIISKVVSGKIPAKVYNLVNSKKVVENSGAVQGVVTALPGTLGSQYFYIAGDKQAYQIYNYKKDFPDLALGDMITVTGEKSLINDETRVKTKSGGDMQLVSQKNKFDSLEIKSGEENDSLLGTLVSFEGEVVKKSGSDIYFDDGLGEFRVYLKQTSGIKSSVFDVGNRAKITGILSKSKSGYQVLPRVIEDIAFLNSDNLGEVLGEYSSSSHWKLTTKEKKFPIKYLLVGGCSLLIALSIGVLRIKNKEIKI